MSEIWLILAQHYKLIWFKVFSLCCFQRLPRHWVCYEVPARSDTAHWRSFFINATMHFGDMAAYKSFSSIAEEQKDLEHLIKFPRKKCEISHLPIPFFCRPFTCSILAFLAHVLLSHHRCAISQQYRLSPLQPFWLKYCGYLSPGRCFLFFLKLLCYLRLMFQFFHIILTSCVCEDAKSAFSHLLHILLEIISLLPLPKSTSLLDRFTDSGSELPLSSKSSVLGQTWKKEGCTFCLWRRHLSPIQTW